MLDYRLLTKHILYTNLEHGFTLEFENLIKLAEWLEIPVYEVVNALDYDKEFEGWLAERVFED